MPDHDTPAAKPVALHAAQAAPRLKPSNYPEPFFSMMTGRSKRPLGDPFGLTSFGVNDVTMAAGATSSLFHQHAVQDEWIYVLSGQLTLIHDGGETVMTAGMCAGFAHGGSAHQLLNRSDADAVYLEVGDRQADDSVTYPRDDLLAVRVDNGWQFAHKDGTPYPK